MLKTYYAITQRVKSGTVKKNTSPYFHGDTRDNKTFIRYDYNELINIINSDRNIRLFESEDAAIAAAKEIEILEDRAKDTSFTLTDFALSAISPLYAAAKVVTTIADAVLPPTQDRNLYQSIILKLKVNVENPLLQDPLNTPDCVGVLPTCKFGLETPDLSHADSSKFSKDNRCFMVTLRFRTSVYHSELYHTPKKWKEDLGNVCDLIKDYYAPKLGLFLTGHWMRHHKDEAKELYELIRNTSRANALQILWDKRVSLINSKNCNLEGSFFRRIYFIIETLARDTPVIQVQHQHRPR